MDSLNYTYNSSQWTNQLTHVDDIISSGAHTEDIDDQSAANYTYDEIGNMISDAAEEIDAIEWTVYGKIKKITRDVLSTKPDLEFEYNTAGERVKKKVIPVGVTPYLDDNWYDTITTYYVRDASGNIMATYEHKYTYDPDLAIASENFTVKEWDLYGSSRLGVINGDFDPARIMASRDGVFNSGGQYEPNQPEYTVYELNDYVIDGSTNQLVGTKNYELTNHLGNVLVTITDRKVPNISGSSFTYFNAQVTTVTDYYPFGQQIEERSWTSTNTYRFGFNGKESDNEVSGSGNQQDYGMRIYNTRLGRFLSVDPITKDYPELTPYQFASNMPVVAIDLDGLEACIGLYNGLMANYYGKLAQKQSTATKVKMTPQKMAEQAVKNGAADFSNAKAEKISYNQPIPTPLRGKPGIFAANVGISIWNGLVSTAEKFVNSNTPAGGQKNAADAMANADVTTDWLVNTTPEQKLDDVGDFLTNPHTYEDIVGGYLVGKVISMPIKTPKINANSIKFTNTAAAHMNNPARMVPVQSLEDALNAPLAILKDPQGTNALMHYSQMYKNGKLYNVEVLFEAKTSTIMHFKYTQKAIGPLSEIK